MFQDMRSNYNETLESIKILGTVESILPQSFNRCAALVKFQVSNDNPNYCAANDMLLSKDRSRLCQGVNGADVVVPKSVA